MDDLKIELRSLRAARRASDSGRGNIAGGRLLCGFRRYPPRSAGGITREAGGKGHRCEAIDFDVTRKSPLRRMVEKAKALHGRIDILVNCAGVPFNVVPFIHTSSQEWNRIINVNLYGTFLCCREVGR